MKYFIILKIVHSIKVFNGMLSKNPQGYADLINCLQDIRNFIADLKTYLILKQENRL